MSKLPFDEIKARLDEHSLVSPNDEHSPIDEIKARLDEHSVVAPNRQSFLDQAGGEDENLRNLASRLYDEKFGSPQTSLLQSAIAPAPAPSAPMPHTHVGPYRVERELGRGGMGVVYLASRDDQQYKKQVAIKLLRPGKDGDQIFRRFQNERQILANLEHPNICRMFDGGSTEEGELYFVMEYVRNARPIDEYCRTRNLSIRERLDLFRQACTAVQYAHRFLIVHRDLKPTNILVSDDGVVKLMDFGIAKNLLSGFNDAAPPTVGEQPMTPAYASPEQVRGGTISTASDIYSLGVVLYELLTGHHPFRYGERPLPDLLHSICESEPGRPSLTVLRPSIATAAAEAGVVEKLAKQLRGDLDWIVLMALRKDPMRRYVSVDQFSEDLRRHLEGLPVIARKDTFGYRWAKFFERNTLAAVAVTILVLTTFGGIVSTRHEQARTKEHFNDVRALANSILFEISDAIRDLPGSTPARMLLVKRALTYLDKLERESAGDVSLESELAEAYGKVSEVQYRAGYPNLGDIAGALDSARKGLALRERIDRTDHSLAARLALASAHVRVGEMLDGMGGNVDAAAHLDQALRIREGLYNEYPKNVSVRTDLAGIYRSIGDREKIQGHPQALLDYNRKALAIREALLAEHPDDPETRRQYTVDLVRIADALGNPNDTNLGRYQEAHDTYNKALAIREALASASPSNAVAARDVSTVFQRLGSLLAEMGEDEASVTTSLKGLAIVEKLWGEDPADFEVRREIVAYHDQIGRALDHLGNHSAAEASLRESLDIASELVAKSPASERSRDDEAQSAYLLGTIIAHDPHRDSEAIEQLQWARATWENLLSRNQSAGRYKLKVMRTLIATATIHARKNDCQTARDEYHRAYELSIELRHQDRLGAADRDAPEQIESALAGCQ